MDMDSPETVVLYDKVIGYKTMFDFIAKKMLASSNGRGEVLDICCGPGHLLVSLGRLAPNMMLNALDISHNMLDFAKNKTDKCLPGRVVNFYKGSMYEIPLEGDRFDLVVNSNVIHMSDTLVPLFNEVHRVLKPGGAGVVVGYRRDQPAWVWKIGAAHSRWLRYRRLLLDGFEPVLESSYTSTELVDILKQTDIADFRVTNGRYFMYIQINKG